MFDADPNSGHSVAASHPAERSNGAHFTTAEIKRRIDAMFEDPIATMPVSEN